MPALPDDLTAFLAEHRDSREYRRGLAVKLALQGYAYDVISTILDVTLGFVSQSKKAYLQHGVAGLILKYHGSQPYLTSDERQAVIDWLKAQQTWSVAALRAYIETTYSVIFQSSQSYYDILAAAKITYKKAQQTNPKRDPERVAAKKKRSKT